MKSRNQILVLTLLIGFTLSCRDIFDIDLSEANVNVLAPVDNHVTDVFTQNFWWEEVEGADSYQIQLVEPSFSSIYDFLVDTNLTHEHYVHTLEPGSYQWRIRAKNNSSQSPWQTYSLHVDSTTDLSNQTVLLSLPEDEYYTNDMQVSFSWQEIFSATEYEFQLGDGGFGNLIQDETVTAAQTSYTFSEEGDYQWRVKALNNTSATAFSNPHTFVIDTTPPTAPSLLMPNHEDTIPDETFNFSWTSGQDESPIDFDSLYIYGDDNLINLVKALEKNSITHTDSLGPGDYYWFVTSYDVAGNGGVVSNVRNFVIQ